VGGGLAGGWVCEPPPQAHWRNCGRPAKAPSRMLVDFNGSFVMSENVQKIGWIGTGRMGFPMAERLLKAGHDVTIWNRTRAKAEPLAAKGGKIVDKLSEV